MSVGRGDPTSNACLSWCDSFRLGGNERYFKVVAGPEESHCFLMAGLGVTKAPRCSVSVGGGLKESDTGDLLGAKSLILPPFRSSRWENGLTRGAASLVLAPLQGSGRVCGWRTLDSDWLWERLWSGCWGCVPSSRRSEHLARSDAVLATPGHRHRDQSPATSTQCGVL